MNISAMMPEDLLPRSPGTRALYERLVDQKDFDPSLFQQLMETAGLTQEDRVYVSVCFGISPDLAQVLSRRSYSEFSILNLRLYHEIERSFAEQHLGFEISRDQSCICLLCAIPKQHADNYVEQCIRPELARLEAMFNVTLLAGIGQPETNPAQLKQACESARYMFSLYFFERTQIIDAREYPPSGLRPDTSQTVDLYDSCFDAAFKAMLMRDSSALEKIEQVINVIGHLHYGNRMAVLMRTMQFTGNFVDRLKNYHPYSNAFISMQDELQDEVLAAQHFQQLKEIVHWHFKRHLPLIYKTEKLKGKMVVEMVKSYMQAHYMENLSIEELSRIAYVSPNYFSHLFKNETGQNYKAYLTAIRMEHAVEMLKNAEYHIYEIAERVGYNNTRTFVDAFRQLYNVSPLEFRRRLRRAQEGKDTD